LEKAYVLLSVELGSGREVLNALEEMPEVKETHQLYGVYDLIVQVEAETVQELKELIEKKIRGVEKIRSAMPLIFIKAGDFQVGIGKRA